MGRTSTRSRVENHRTAIVRSANVEAMYHPLSGMERLLFIEVVLLLPYPIARILMTLENRQETKNEHD